MSTLTQIEPSQRVGQPLALKSPVSGAKALIQATHESSQQSSRYLDLMHQMQQDHERQTAAQRLEYATLLQKNTSEIDDLKRELLSTKSEKELAALKLKALADKTDQSEILKNDLERQLTQSTKKIEQLEAALETAHKTIQKIAAYLAQAQSKLESFTEDQKTQIERSESRFQKNEQNTAELEERLGQVISKNQQLEVSAQENAAQLAEEKARRIALEETQEKMSDLRSQIAQARELSIEKGMRSSVQMNFYKAMTWIYQQVNCGSIPFVESYLAFRNIERTIRAVNLDLYSLKARAQESQFFGLSLELKKNRIREFGLDPYLLILTPEDHIGPRELTDAQFKEINESFLELEQSGT